MARPEPGRPPNRIELRTVEHELSWPPDRARDRWALVWRGDAPAVTFDDTDLELDVLSVIHRADGRNP